MQITSVGHAGFHIQTEAGSILCDPWVTPDVFCVLGAVPRQHRVGLGRAGQLRLPLRLAPAQGPLRSEESDRARQQGRHSPAPPRLPGAGPQA